MPKGTNRRRRTLHFRDANGVVACNPRDREAAHRAEMEGLATENPEAVTCKKCRLAIRGSRKEERLPVSRE